MADMFERDFKNGEDEIDSIDDNEAIDFEAKIKDNAKKAEVRMNQARQKKREEAKR